MNIIKYVIEWHKYGMCLKHYQLHSIMISINNFLFTIGFLKHFIIKLTVYEGVIKRSFEHLNVLSICNQCGKVPL